jgi:hypothetical protein
MNAIDLALALAAQAGLSTLKTEPELKELDAFVNAQIVF